MKGDAAGRAGARWEEPRGDRGLAAALVLVFGLSAFLLEAFYGELASFYASSIFGEDHGYLVAAAASFAVALCLAAGDAWLSPEVRPSKVLAIALLAVAAVEFKLLAGARPDMATFFDGMSFSSALLAIASAALTPRRPAGALVLASAYALVPLPASWLDFLAPPLSRLVASLASAVTGAALVEGPASAYLVVQAPNGTVELEVARACTGLASMSSVLALLPISAYFAAGSRGGLARRALAFVAPLAAGAAVAFAGNVIRVIAIVEAARALGPEPALSILHYSPSLAYSAIAAAVAVLLASRLGGGGRDPGGGVAGGRAAGAMALATIVAISLAAPLALASQPARAGAPAISVSSVGDFLRTPASYLAGGGARLAGEAEEAGLRQVLGALAVSRFVVVSGGRAYEGYVEVVDSPARLHAWQYCLGLQGYEVTSSWDEYDGQLLVSFVGLRRGNWTGVLAYSVGRVLLEYPGGSVPMYLRISAIAPEPGEALRVVEAMMPAGGPGGPAGPIELVGRAYVALLIVTAAYAAAALLRRLASSARSRSSRRPP
ncbi:MAG: archaeosortase/exosortase family protein [Desulfurococcaceae archaeon]